MITKAKKVIFNYLEPDVNDPFWEKVFNYFVVFVILLNVFMVTMETVEEIDKKWGELIDVIEDASVIFFTVEYILRLWVCNLKDKFKGKFGRIKYIFSFPALIDLFSILPFFVVFLPTTHLASIRFLRLLSLFIFFKLGMYSYSFKLLDDVWRKKKDLLTASLFLSLFLIVASSFLMYMVEHSAQPDKFTSIPQAMYWSVITLTSTGYGDVYPITDFGKFLTMIITIIGIGMVALPISIFSAGFVEEIEREKREKLEKEKIETREIRYQKYLEYKMEFEPTSK